MLEEEGSMGEPGEEQMDEMPYAEEEGPEGSPGDDHFENEDPAAAEEEAAPEQDDNGMDDVWEDGLEPQGSADEEVRTPEPEDDELEEAAPSPEKNAGRPASPCRRPGAVGAPIGGRPGASKGQ